MRLYRQGNFRRPTVCKAPPPGGFGIGYILTLNNLVRFGTGMELNYQVTWDGVGPNLPHATLFIVAPTFIDHFVTASDGAQHDYQRLPADKSPQQVWTCWLTQNQFYGPKLTITSTP